MIAHIVLFSPRPELTPEQRRSLAITIRDTFAAIQVISRASIGRAVDLDPGYERIMGNKTYEFAAVLEFKSSDDLLTYLRDPRHGAIGKMFWELCERAVVIEVEMLRSDDPHLVDFLSR